MLLLEEIPSDAVVAFTDGSATSKKGISGSEAYVFGLDGSELKTSSESKTRIAWEYSKPGNQIHWKG